MRLLCEIFVIGGLIYLGWEKPFREWLPESITGVSSTQNARPALPVRTRQPLGATAKATPIPSGTWMWDPTHKTSLDRPAYNQTRSFTGHITYVDENGKAYWLDARGIRHYEP